MSTGKYSLILMGFVAVMLNTAVLKKLSDEMGVHNHATAPPQCDISMAGKDTDTDITPPQRPHAQPTGVFKSGR